MKRPIFVFALAFAVLITSPVEVLAAKDKAAGGRVTQDHSFGKKTSPSEVRQETHPSGRKDTFYGNKRRADGSIDRPHGHTVQSPDGKIQYARTPGGKVLKNSRKHVDKGTSSKK